LTEREVFQELATARADEAVVIANGYLSRYAFDAGDARENFYMIGSMGLALSIGLGLAIAQPRRRVVVVDGDGNLLMSLGALAMVGYTKPSNLMHIVIDNQQYASTGGQASVSGAVQMSQLAQAAGYRIARETRDAQELWAALQQLRATPGPSFLCVYVKASTDAPPRVRRSPEEVAETFRRSMLGK
jgi:thiamine pyrophosphate-dependent acetolactate synthase large subunit-like protein